jgi:multidrug transporter EmrE-like cation transporter
MNSWLLLLLAGVLEIGRAIGLKYADGFTKLLSSALTIAAMIASMYLLAPSARRFSGSRSSPNRRTSRASPASRSLSWA